METPLERVPCAVAVVLAKASETLASSPGSEIYRVVNRCELSPGACSEAYPSRVDNDSEGFLDEPTHVPLSLSARHILQLVRLFFRPRPSPFPGGARVGSFLLHRPFVRLDELPLFDTLFTGVQQGEGGRDGGRGGVGEALGAASASDPGAATTKARVWMLRALRDGEREEERKRRRESEVLSGLVSAVPLYRSWSPGPWLVPK